MEANTAENLSYNFDNVIPLKDPLNSIKDFYSIFKIRNPGRPSVLCLYFTLKDLAGSESLKVTSKKLQELTGLSKPTIIKCRIILENIGLIKFKQIYDTVNKRQSPSVYTVY